MATHANSSGKKKIPTKTHSKTPCSNKSSSTTKRRVWDYLVSVPKIELVVGATLDRSEPSPRFASNGINKSKTHLFLSPIFMYF